MEGFLSGLPEWLKVIVYGILGTAFGGYATSRIRHRDQHNDAVDNKSQKLIDTLQTQLSAERAHSSHLGTVIDRVSAERNDAVRDVGRLEGTVQALSAQVEHLSAEVQELEEQNKKLTDEVHEARKEMKELSQQVAAAIAINEKLIAALGSNATP